MSQPTQDTDITSSISPLFHVTDDRFNEKRRIGNDVKTFVQERRATSLTMETLYSNDRKSDDNETSKDQGSELVKSLGETFPWLIKFYKVIQSAVGSKNPKLLDRLLFVYIENMSRDVNMCYTKPHRAAKVKTHINDTLIFFHLYWKCIKERVDDHYQYLDKIAEILGMYVDMELKASRRGKDSASKIAAKLLTAMFIYLDNSEEHIFRILFRAKFVTKNYSQICDPIFKKLFAGLSGGRKSVTDVKYVRYLLALKLWKRIKDDLQEKKKINELALTVLGQQIPSMNNELLKIIPKPPESFKNGTLWLLQPNSFDLRKACDQFIQYKINERIISLPESMEQLKVTNSFDTPITQDGLESIDRLQQKPIPESNKSVDGEQRTKKVIKLRRFKPSFPKLRPGEVVFIDLTGAENEDNKREDLKKKKKRVKKKLKWLKEAGKKSKLKKRTKMVEKTWVQKADAHSTANNWPISEDKITESTEQMQRFAVTKYENSEDFVTSQTSSALINDSMVFAKEEFHLSEAAPREIFINCMKQEAKDSGAHSSRLIHQSHGDYYATNKNERNAVNKMMKEEREDVIDDSTTVKNCDKIILTDSSSFNLTKKPVSKLKTEEKIQDNFDIPSTSYNKSTIYSSTAHGKTFKVKDQRINETCIVSTTASVADSEQINVISDSTSKNLESNLNNLNNNNTVKNSERVFQTSKELNPMETSIDDAVNNNKLQNSLMHALSLDQMIQIGKDDVDSQCEDGDDKECRSEKLQQGTIRSQNKKFTLVNEDNDFFQIPELQLCDGLTNDEDLVAPGAKNKVDEFENIDILDSILNGDMSMQDILEEQQSFSMNSTGNDASNNMFGFFTEFFKQSEVTFADKKDFEIEERLRPDEVPKSLPEGSLGMTGILNSLLDSDLTSIDSPPSDFMYSNVQSVDPRLIRKSPTTEPAAYLNDFSIVSDLFSQKEQSTEENFSAVDSLSKKTKDLLFLDQKNSLNCNDLEEFGLNGSKETEFEMPVLEEELIQLPPHPLIDETIIPPASCESQENLGEVKSAENCYEYSRLGHFQEFASFRLKDIIQHSDNGEDLPTSTLTDFTPPQSVDSPQSPYTFTSSPAPAQTLSQVPHSPTHSVGSSRHTLSTNLLTPPPSVPQFIRQNNLTPPPTPQQSQNEVSNIQKTRVRYLSINSQSFRDDSSQQPESASSLQRTENFQITRRKTDRKLTSDVARSEKNNRARTVASNKMVGDEEEVRLTQVQVALTRLTKEDMRGRTGGEESLLKSNISIKRENAQRQLKTQSTKKLQRIDFRELGIAAQQNKPVFINLNGKTKPALVFERNGKGEVFTDASNRSSNIVYKLTSNVKPATTTDDKPYSKIKNVNFTVQNKVRDIKSNSKPTTKRCANNVVQVSQESKNVVGQRCSTRRIKKSTKEVTNDAKINFTNISSNGEEPAVKRRKTTPKLLPLLKNEGIVCNANQQKTQDKHSNVIRRGNIAVLSSIQNFVHFFYKFEEKFRSSATNLFLNFYRSQFRSIIE